ncbi:thiamine pyrophosphate-binding protein [Xanthobacter sp. DSM 24535]|uniref:thiamine pyrophosphate-binding protein n=1 Tax=Roseixanthobacter psychrophilus TaxID=3119917 RepID=UPI00372AFAD7
MNTHSPAPAAQPAATRNGGQILVDALRIHGADRIFGVPGESALPVFDALHEGEKGVRFVMCRHEANASHMAEADGKLTGLPGLCLVSRGPGAMHATVGVHTAWQDSTPMILIVGQVPRTTRGREGFQEINYVRVFADMAKWVGEIESADLIPEYVSRAYHIATQGRPGPVVLSIPEDVLASTGAVVDAPAFHRASPAPAASDMARLRDILQGAQRPLVIIGGSTWTAEAAGKVSAFCAASGLPVAAGFRSQDLVNNDLPHYVGHLTLGSSPALTERVKAADVLLVIGDRLGEITSKAYSALDVPAPKQTLIHVHPGAEELGRVYNADLPILSGMERFADALAELEPLESGPWTDWAHAARAEFEAFQQPPTRTAGFDLGKMILHLREVLPDDAIIANGAGNYTVWLHRFFRYRTFGTQMAPKSGSMAYGLPGAIAAKLRHPERTVVALAGDGCFQMASPEFATAVHYKLPIVVIVVNNAIYGSIRMHQERHFPGRPSGTFLTNPDFAALARSYGAHGEVVSADADFPAALARARATGGPAIVEVRVPSNQLTPDMIL